MDVEQTQAKQKNKYRGKLYALTEDSAWQDAGTGHTSIITVKGDNRRLIFRDEQSGEIIHDRPVFSSELYQLQGEGERQTIIVWEDQEQQKDWALSFQDPDGTSEIYDLICNNSEVAESKRLLPLPTIGNLQELGLRLNMVPPSQREPLAGECASQKFISELRESFRTAEDLEDEKELHHIFLIVKGIFLLSNHKLTERYLRDDIYEDVLGMLEFDKTLPPNKRLPHREVIKNNVKYNDVLSFEDASTLDRIHFNYRLQYLKDIVLPRTLDDAAFASLTQMIFTNLSIILNHLEKNTQILDKLLEQVRQQDMQSLLFLQDACRVSRQIPPTQRQVLFDKMVERGLFDALAVYFSGDSNVANGDIDAAGAKLPKEHPARHHAVEVFLLHAQCDPSHLRNFLTREDNEAGRMVLSALIQLMLTEEDQGVQGQIAELIRAVMDPSVLEHRERDGRLDVFYERGAMDEIVAPLQPDVAKPTSPQACFALQLVCEIVAFAIARHGYRGKVYFIRHGLAQQASRLLSAPQRYLQLAAVRVFRAIVGTKDEAYHRYLTKNGLMAPLLKSFEDSLAPPALGSNLLVSSTLELLEFIRLENLKILVEHIVKQHGPLLQRYAAKLQTLEGLLLKYHQNLEYKNFPPEQHEAGGPVDGSSSAGRPGQRRTRSPGREDSAEDDSYFESLDDDSEEQQLTDEGQPSEEQPSPRSAGDGVDGILEEQPAVSGDPAKPEEGGPGSGGLQGLLGGYADEEDEEKAPVAESRDEVAGEESSDASGSAAQVQPDGEAAADAEASSEGAPAPEKSLGHASKRARVSESLED
eukprot:TRINITY_DN7031_c0_g2_i1.p1 TRINITY_DN7031_c0_g2~~TRINITY_DN7031_c0_g2_i1.p1  ORF type:complete len:812 (+),score=195.25 TRINITY_DN7031_c0_g2_i1:129-2564(+)